MAEVAKGWTAKERENPDKKTMKVESTLVVDGRKVLGGAQQTLTPVWGLSAFL
jgi:hypothetical protein